MYTYTLIPNNAYISCFFFQSLQNSPTSLKYCGIILTLTGSPAGIRGFMYMCCRPTLHQAFNISLFKNPQNERLCD